MAEKEPSRDIRTMIHEFRTSEHWAVSLARDILWVAAVVGGIALALYLICGTWPAVVTVESGSMEPHMNIGDLVVVVQQDRFGPVQTWNEAKTTGYQKFGDYGDVIIYRPNGETDFWAQIGLLPLSKQHPIIHRAMTWVDAGEPEPSYLNIYGGSVTPTEYLPLEISNMTVEGYKILYTGATLPPANLTFSSYDLIINNETGKYRLPSSYVTSNIGYIQYGNATTHGGYITKGDNNQVSDEGSIMVAGVGMIEPVEKEWVVGKALFTIPLVGLLPLHIWEVVIVVIVVMVAWDWYAKRKETASGKKARKSRKPQKGSRQKK
ncbi:MAG: S26 family signal peptidase [Methanoregula sp.]|jgi:signal peptidase|uniref:S26 family signal peptidase n=1 Tax=Methanoregula sp. TaxID=2052170 RepID=UPI003D123AB5